MGCDLRGFLNASYIIHLSLLLEILVGRLAKLPSLKLPIRVYFQISKIFKYSDIMIKLLPDFIQDPFSINKGKFCFSRISQRLETLYSKLN